MLKSCGVSFMSQYNRHICIISHTQTACCESMMRRVSTVGRGKCAHSVQHRAAHPQLCSTTNKSCRNLSPHLLTHTHTCTSIFVRALYDICTRRSIKPKHESNMNSKPSINPSKLKPYFPKISILG